MNDNDQKWSLRLEMNQSLTETEVKQKDDRVLSQMQYDEILERMGAELLEFGCQSTRLDDPVLCSANEYFRQLCMIAKLIAYNPSWLGDDEGFLGATLVQLPAGQLRRTYDQFRRTILLIGKGDGCVVVYERYPGLCVPLDFNQPQRMNAKFMYLNDSLTRKDIQQLLDI